MGASSDHSDSGQGAISRRDLLMWAAAGSLSATAIFALRTLGFIVVPPARSIEGKTKIGPQVVASMSELKEKAPKIVEYGDDFVWLVRMDDSKLLALNAACPHVACKLHFNEKMKQFDCPCHASSFTIEGKKLFGPAPRDMDPAVFEIKGQDIVVSGFEKA